MEAGKETNSTVESIDFMSHPIYSSARSGYTAKTAVAVANKEKLQPSEKEEDIHTIWYISNRAEQGASGQGERIKHNSCTYSVNMRNFRYHHHRCCPGQDRFGKVRRSFCARTESHTH